MVILWMVSTAFISTSGLIAGIFLVTAGGDDADVLAISGIGTIVVSIYFLVMRRSGVRFPSRAPLKVLLAVLRRHVSPSGLSLGQVYCRIASREFPQLVAERNLGIRSRQRTKSGQICQSASSLTRALPMLAPFSMPRNASTACSMPSVTV